MRVIPMTDSFLAFCLLDFMYLINLVLLWYNWTLNLLLKLELIEKVGEIKFTMNFRFWWFKNLSLRFMHFFRRIRFLDVWSRQTSSHIFMFQKNIELLKLCAFKQTFTHNVCILQGLQIWHRLIWSFWWYCLVLHQVVLNHHIKLSEDD